jgi:nitrite reductase (NADH) large subunit
VVASPIYKQHFCLATGRCLEEGDFSVTTYPVRLVEGQVWVRPEPIRPQRAPGKRRLVVVGNGMAGMRTVEELLQIAPDLYEVEIFGAEPHGNYNRILLSPVLSGEKQIEEIMLHPLDWYTEHGVTLHAGDLVIQSQGRRTNTRGSIESGGA